MACIRQGTLGKEMKALRKRQISIANSFLRKKDGCKVKNTGEEHLRLIRQSEEDAAMKGRGSAARV